MESDDLESFKSLLAELFGAIDKPLTEAKTSAFWKGLNRMALIEFARTQELLLAELETTAPPKNFTVHDIWQAKRRLRASALRTEITHQAPVWQGDSWDVGANRHFMAMLARRAMSKLGGFGDAETRVLLEAKRAWSALMREEAEGTDGTVDIETQMAMWNGKMSEAHHKLGHVFVPLVYRAPAPEPLEA